MASNELSLFATDSASSKEKAPGALRTISEASELLDIPQHVLRFWETKFVQIKPLKRNGGRRFYRPQDLEVLQQIKHLLYAQGYTIKGAQKAVAEFAATRGKDSAPVDRWATPSFPPAHGNDNSQPVATVATESAVEFDILSEIAELLSEPDDIAAGARLASASLPVVAAAAYAPNREALQALRSELQAMRSALTDVLHG